MSVRHEPRGPALWLLIDRPARRNALTAEVMRGLLDGLDRAGGDEGVRAVVLTGSGEEAFCAGADLGGLAGEAPGEGLALLGRVLEALNACPKPVVARVNGTALGGGLGLVLACDLAVAADDAELGLPEVNLGLWPHVVTAVAQRTLPRKVALEMMLTGRRLAAPEAARWGIVNRAVPGGELDAAVESLVAELAAKSPAALRLGKRSFYGAQDLAFAEALAWLYDRLAEHLSLEDVAEGVAAFLEKRQPDWRGR